jgi:FAD:protein FMN transferase
MDRASVSIRRAQPLLGTFVEISVAGATRSEMDAAVDAAFAAVAKVHRLMSFHDVQSDVSRLNRKASTHVVPVHPWTFAVLAAAIDFDRRSSGIFDIAVAPVLQEMGLLPPVHDDPSSTAPIPRSIEVVELLPDRRVRFQYPGVRIDLGGIAKGFAVDRAIAVLRRRGTPSGVVNAGGDLAAFGPHPHRVHVRDPRDPRRLICRTTLTAEALASSGGAFDRSAQAMGSIVIDPRTRAPVRSIAGATVRAPSCMVADALTKLVMIAGEDASALLAHCSASALFVSASGDVRITPDWQGGVELAA